jgi:hypothetical protein
MATPAPQTFRIPLALLAAANLAGLGVILWPWPQALNLPVNGSAAIDPAVTLAIYIGLVFYISSGLKDTTKKVLSLAGRLGLAAGVVLGVRAVLGVRLSVQPGFLRPGLLGVAVLLWGFAGLRGSKVGGSTGMGALAGLWSAITSGLLATAAILAELYFAGPTQASPDLWKQYEGLAIGNSATQGMVHSLNAVTALLLVGPLTGVVVGMIFGFFGQNRKS